MKKPLFLFTLLLCGTLTFAQTAFTKATLDGILKTYQQNPHEFFKNYCPPDFRYINPDGSFMYLPQLLVTSVNDKIESTEILEQKIAQSGDVAVVSGIHVATRAGKDGTKSIRKVACTYTFQRQNRPGSAPRWMFVASQQNLLKNSPDEMKADEAAIKAVLEGHTLASYDDDAERAVSYFADSPYAAISYQDPGSGYIRGGEAVKAKYREVFSRPTFVKKPGKLSTGEYLYRIVGNTAFVTYVETDTQPDGSTTRTHKVNYLEKQGGAWKMIGNFWMPEMKATTNDEAAIKKVIEEEHAASRARDYAKLLHYFAKSDHTVFGFQPGMMRGYEAMEKAVTELKARNLPPTAGTTAISDYRIRLQGNAAFVSSIALSTRPDGTQVQTNKAQYLEKQNGDWKIVGNLYSNVPIEKSK